MSCDAQGVINALVLDGYLKLADRDKLLSMCGILSQAAGNITGTQAVNSSYAQGFSRLSDRQIDEIAVAIMCPPCVVPSTPTTPTQTAVTSTSISIAWTQPASPSTITGYIVRWGTSPGVYTFDSGELAAVPLSYTLTGLNASITYYMVVQAFSDACTSANSGEFADTTSAPGPCNAGVTFANAWSTQVQANGGAAPSQNTLDAIANLQCGLIAAGLDSQMIAWNIFAPDSLIAALTPQLKGNGNALWTNNNFVGGDLTVNGLTGNATNKFLQTGELIDASTTASNIGTFAYCAVTAASVNGRAFGVLNGGFLLVAPNDNTANAHSASGGNPSNVITTPSQGAGFYTDQRINGSDHRLFFANSTTPLAQIGATDVNGVVTPLPGIEFYVFCLNNGGSVFGFTSETLSGVGVTKGLVQADAATLFGLFQTARISLGGGHP